MKPDCPDCEGTGIDRAKTAFAQTTEFIAKDGIPCACMYMEREFRDLLPGRRRVTRKEAG